MSLCCLVSPRTPRGNRSRPENCRFGWPKWKARAPGRKTGRGSGGRRIRWRGRKAGASHLGGRPRNRHAGLIPELLGRPGGMCVAPATERRQRALQLFPAERREHLLESGSQGVVELRSKVRRELAHGFSPAVTEP